MKARTSLYAASLKKIVLSMDATPSSSQKNLSCMKGPHFLSHSISEKNMFARGARSLLHLKLNNACGHVDTKEIFMVPSDITYL